MKKNNQSAAACLFLFAFVTLFARPVQAQTTSRASFETAIVGDFCDTFSKSSSQLTKENLSVQLGMLILPLFSKYQAQIESEWGLVVSDSKDIRAIGEKIGQLATINCPAFHDYIKTNLKEIVDEREEESVKTFSGKIIRVEGTPFTYLVVQNSQGRTDKFYWMEFFPGADKLGSSPKTYLKKPVQITYREMETYQALAKEYKTVKVITNVSF